MSTSFVGPIEYGVHLEQKLHSAFQDIVRCYTPPGCQPLICAIDPVKKDGDVHIMQLAALRDDVVTEHETARMHEQAVDNFFDVDSRYVSSQGMVISNLSDTFVEASLSIQVDEKGLKVSLPTQKDIENFLDLHGLLERSGVFRFNF